MSSNYESAGGLLPSELMPVYKNHQALPIMGSTESLKELLNNPSYPNPYECSIYSGTAPTDGLEYYVDDIGLPQDSLWHIKYFPGNSIGESLMVAYPSSDLHVTMHRRSNGATWSGWTSQGDTPYVSWMPLSPGSSLFEYITSDNCPSTLTTTIRCQNNPDAPAIYSKTSNDLLYIVNKANATFASVEAIDFRSTQRWTITYRTGAWDTEWQETSSVPQAPALNYADRIAIGENADLNTYTKAGTYYILTEAILRTIANAPDVSSGGFLDIYWRTDQFFHQVFTTWEGIEFRRGCSSGVFTDWYISEALLPRAVPMDSAIVISVTPYKFPNDEGETIYNFQRYINDAWTTIWKGTNISYCDSNLNNNEVYRYRVYAENSTETMGKAFAAIYAMPVKHTNPNLLINGDFKINQRGAERVTGSFSVDHWRTSSPYIDHIVTSDGLEICPNATLEVNASALQQRMDCTPELIGQSLTASVYMVQTNQYAYMQIYALDENEEIAAYSQKILLKEGVNSVTLTEVPETAITIRPQLTLDAPATTTDSIKVKWMKLEVGSVMTPFISPDPIVELIKVQSTDSVQSTPKLVSDYTLPTLMNSQMVSNPNLLVNPDFKINQRGLKLYDRYRVSVDRWRTSTAANLTVNDDGSVTLTYINNGLSTSAYLHQNLEPDLLKKLYGKEISISTCVNGKIYTSSGNIVPTYDELDSSTNTRIARVVIDGGSAFELFASQTAAVAQFYTTTEITNIQWTKLELGRVATAFTPPDPALELIKCGTPDDSNILFGYAPNGVTINPNLLINPDFKINQRGLSEYAPTTRVFTVDNWRFISKDAASVGSYNADTRVLTTPGEWQGLSQPLRNYNSLVGKTITVSASVTTDDTWYIGAWKIEKDAKTLTSVAASAIYGGANYGTCTFTVPEVEEDKLLEVVIQTTGSLTLGYVKAELGSVATAFIPPNPAEELLKIQSMDELGNLRIVSNEQLPSLMNSQMVSNPNLLINPDFKINQRGQSEYIGKSNYGVDMWGFHRGDSTIFNVDTKTMTIPAGKDWYGIYQKLENGTDYIGKTLTFSAKLKASVDNTYLRICYKNTSSAEIAKIIPTGYDGIISITGTIPADATLVEVQITNKGATTTGGTIQIEWAKLEVGHMVTPFIPPDPATELVKCQRCFEPIAMVVNPYGAEVNNIVTQGFFKVTKRITPTLTIKSLNGIDTDAMGVAGNTTFKIPIKAYADESRFHFDYAGMSDDDTAPCEHNGNVGCTVYASADF